MNKLIAESFRKSKNESQIEDQKDTVTLDIPLLVRVFEMMREDVPDDATLHEIVEKMLDVKNKGTLTMADYEYLLSPLEDKGPVAAKEAKVTTSKDGRKYITSTTGELIEISDELAEEYADDEEEELPDYSPQLEDIATLDRDGEKFWAGVVNIHDGYIEEVHTYAKAKDADFHHSYYVSQQAYDQIAEGDALMFFVYSKEDITIWDGYPSAEITKSHKRSLIIRIKEQISFI